MVIDKIQRYSSAISQIHNNFCSLGLHGICLAYCGKYEEAAEIFDNAKKLSESELLYINQDGVPEYKREFIVECLKETDHNINIANHFPEFVNYLENPERENIKGDYVYDSWHNQAINLIEKESYIEALNVSKYLVDMNANPYSCSLQAISLVHNDKFNEALQLFNKAKELIPQENFEKSNKYINDVLKAVAEDVPAFKQYCGIYVEINRAQNLNEDKGEKTLSNSANGHNAGAGGGLGSIGVNAMDAGIVFRNFTRGTTGNLPSPFAGYAQSVAREARGNIVNSL